MYMNLLFHTHLSHNSPAHLLTTPQSPKAIKSPSLNNLPTPTPEPTTLLTNGWLPVPRSFTNSLADIDPDKQAVLAAEACELPDSQLARKTWEFVKAKVSARTFHHCLRGHALISTHFPHLHPLREKFYLTCLLHDLGTTPTNLAATNMSFEYHGAIQAMHFLRENGAPTDQVEAVGEAIIRHADFGETGSVTGLGFLVLLGTGFGVFFGGAF
ncbi:hypothetical protein LEMA_P034290.1 [Plenodomus lingam JN3]|uniref:Uncharacterized protein n=1 Tax=Leptosphaeria maculans (strain JN3 / isolate v23.1.3 / race Av1-4-5-6-7-8) TaxID=985895 RepID=E4ZR90_LEPMJ|nr:hypothetical protein LEMA_P034290.1 [Plenodomus lingam JN3]CBX93755.1 hypothetical protein LEMA_P034290.1 [Plenodomus lingam JN3]